MEAVQLNNLYRQLYELGVTDPSKQDQILQIFKPYMQRHEDEIFEIEQDVEDAVGELEQALENAQWEIRRRKKARNEKIL